MSSLRRWQITAALLGLLAITMVAFTVTYLPPIVAGPGPGTLGYDGEATAFEGFSAHRIRQLENDSPLASAGIRIGELLVAPPRGMLRGGQLTTLRVAGERGVREVSVRAAPVQGVGARAELGFEAALQMLALALGILACVRRPNDLAALVLASGFFLAAAALSPNLQPIGSVAPLLELTSILSGSLFLAVLVRLAAVLCGPGARELRGAQWFNIGLCIVWVAWTIMMAPYFFGRAPIAPPAVMFDWVRPLLMVVSIVLCAVAFVSTWQRVRAERRERLRWLFVGFAVVLVALGAGMAYIFGAFGFSAAATFVFDVAIDVLVALALAILAYAILRRRVIDVGFAISHGLLFTVLAGAMLMGFGVVEWAVDHVLEFEGREKNVMLDGALALGVYLVFHRIQHSIKHLLERTFFRSWHLKAVALDRFLETSAHFEDAGALSKAFVEAVDAYADCEGCALYRRGGRGGLYLKNATLADVPPSLAPDDGAVIELKAFPRALLLGGKLSIGGGAWALPLVRRSEVISLLVVGRKRDQDIYRPDEIAHLWRATRQVGFDLYALTFEQGTDRGTALVGESPLAVPPC